MARHKILLADDSATIRKVVELTFADEGVDVFSVSDGDAAMTKFVEIQPDLVMADVNMPGMGGYRLCEMIKQDESTQHIPFILLVGSFEPFDPGEASRVGSNYYFTKPFRSIRELVEKVTEYLELGGDSSSIEAETADIEDLYNDSFQTTLEMPRPEVEAAAFAVESEDDEPPRLDETQAFDAIDSADDVHLLDLDQPDDDIQFPDVAEPAGVEQTPEPFLEETAPETDAADVGVLTERSPWEVPVAVQTDEREPPASISLELGDPGMDDEIIETSHPGADAELVEAHPPYEPPPDAQAAEPIDPFVERVQISATESKTDVAMSEFDWDTGEEPAGREVPAVEPVPSPIKFAFDEIETAAAETTLDDQAPVDEKPAAEQPVTLPNHVTPELIESIVQAVLEKMSDRAVRDVATQAVPRIAEKLIREALDDER